MFLKANRSSTPRKQFEIHGTQKENVFQPKHGTMDSCNVFRSARRQVQSHASDYIAHWHTVYGFEIN